MLSAIKTRGRGFAKDQCGAVAITFGFAFLALLLAVGVAIDFGRMHHARTQLAGAVDAAALAGGRQLLNGMSDAKVNRAAFAAFKANLKNGNVDFGPTSDPTIQINRQTGEIKVDATANLPMTISAITGVQERPVGAEATVNAQGQDLEVALAIDVTSSMGWDNKLDALKDATEEFFDIILPENGVPNQRRVALAPYSSGVNAGELSDELLDDGDTNQCTFERDDDDGEPTKDSLPEKGLSKNFLRF